MPNNPVLRIVLSTLLLIGLILVLSPILRPKIPDAANENKRQADPVGQLGNESDKPENGNVENQDPADQPAPAGNDPGAEGDDPPLPQPERPDHPREFLTLGRFDPDAGPLVIQLDSLGATVQRITINARRDGDRFAYRDVDYHEAWIGQLELLKSGDACLVQVVAPGTPADLAGIRPDELITRIDGEPVLDPVDFDRKLATIKAGANLQLTVRGTDETVRDVNVTSMRKPMEVLTPTAPELVTVDQLKRRGFQFSLKERASNDWPDLDEAMRTGNWEARRFEGSETVEFTYRLPVLEDGRKFQVVKRFSLPPERDAWHLNLEVEIRNVGDQPAQVWYELWGPAGLPTEGWWYQQKIHGNTWAIGRMAGARDILVSNLGQGFRFFSGPQIVTDRQNQAAGTLIIPHENDEMPRTIRYLAVDTLYFTIALQSGDPEEMLRAYSVWAAPVSRIADENKQRAQKLTDVNFVIYGDAGELEPYDAESGSGAWKQSFRIFAGPKDPEILQRYGLDEARTFGWFWMFSRPLTWLLHALYWITGGLSYGIAIILLTVIVRSLMIPISRKAAINAQMMQHLTPEIKELAEKYKEQPEKRMKAQQELFAKYKYNPFGGCLLMFLQLPIFLGLYRGLSVDVALRDAPLIPGLKWCSNLAGPDQLFYWGDWMPGFLASETGWLGPYFNLLPIATIVLMLIQQKMFMPPATDEQSRMMQRMMKFMMIFMAFIFFKVASGLCVYFITSSIWSIIERKMLPKPQLNVEKFQARAETTSVKSLFSRQPKPLSDDPAELAERSQRSLDARRQRDRERQRKLRDRN